MFIEKKSYIGPDDIMARAAQNVVVKAFQAVQRQSVSPKTAVAFLPTLVNAVMEQIQNGIGVLYGDRMAFSSKRVGSDASLITIRDNEKGQDCVSLLLSKLGQNNSCALIAEPKQTDRGIVMPGKTIAFFSLEGTEVKGLQMGANPRVTSLDEQVGHIMRYVTARMPRLPRPIAVAEVLVYAEKAGLVPQ